MLARTRATSSSRPTGLNKILRLVCPSVHSQHLDPGTSPDRTMYSFFGITAALLISWIPYLTHSFSIPCRLTSFATDNHRKSHHVPERALRMMFRNDDDGSSAAVDRLVGTVLLGGALLVGGGVGLISGADVVRADVSISPRCELRMTYDANVVCSFALYAVSLMSIQNYRYERGHDRRRVTVYNTPRQLRFCRRLQRKSCQGGSREGNYSVSILEHMITRSIIRGAALSISAEQLSLCRYAGSLSAFSTQGSCAGPLTSWQETF